MNNKYNSISKSQYIKGLQCPKALWFFRNRPDLKPEISASQQALFNAGHEVGELAQQYFQNGVEITEKYNEIPQAIRSTQAAIQNGAKVLYEATARSKDGAYSRIDILKKINGSDFWDLIEVKMSTKVREYHMNDMALQRYAFTGAGYKIRKSILMHLNNQYTRFGALDINKLFTLEDCTDDVEVLMQDVGKTVANLLKIINQDNEPKIEPGDHCYAPFECDYTGHCCLEGPEHSVYDIFKRGRRLDDLLEDNIIDVRDIPDDFAVTDRQNIAIDSYKNNTVYKDKDLIHDFLQTLEYPLYFLDYETIYPAVPLFDNSRPYQHIPFQFSLHIQKEKNGDLEHIEFLHTGKNDPRPGFIKTLIENCGKKGSVVIYNKAFENRINNELIAVFPEFQVSLDNISERMIDLLVPFRSRYIYHPDMKGSASLKSVLPAFVPELSYDNLEIGDGGTASEQYLSCIKNIVTGEEREKIFTNLRKYCAQDTLAEVKLIDVLYNN